MTETGLKLCTFGSPQNTFVYEKKGYPDPLATTRKFRPKWAWNYALEKGLKCAFMVPRNTHSLMKWRAAPSQPPEIIYFCKFRPKKAWNYAYLACKMIFLGKGAPPPCNHIYVNILTEKGLKLCIYGSQEMHILL